MTKTPRLVDQLVSMTSIRDLDLLEVSLLKTIQRLRDLEHLTLLKMAGAGAVQSEITYSSERCAIRHSNIQLSPEVQSAISQLDNRDNADTHFTLNNRHISVFSAKANRRSTTYLVIDSGEALQRIDIQLIAALLQFYRNFCELLQEAQTDPLTGLANRKTFDEVFNRFQTAKYVPLSADLEVEVERRNTANLQHWLVMVDIDHFKRINDQFGHLYGDEILILLAQQFKKSLRLNDEIFRFGGEEFVLIVHCQSADEVKTTLDRLRHSIEVLTVPQVHQVTVSIGATQITSNTFSGTLLDYADKALYWSKEHGRNQVTLFEDLVQQGHAEYEREPDDMIDYF